MSYLHLGGIKEVRGGDKVNNWGKYGENWSGNNFVEEESGIRGGARVTHWEKK